MKRREIAFGIALVLSLFAMMSCGDDGSEASASEPRDSGAGANKDADTDTATDTDTGADTDAETDAGKVADDDLREIRSELPHDTEPDISDEDFQAFVAGTNAFGFNLFTQLAGDGNLVFSPVSVATALGMTYAGARHNTAVEMAQTLHNDLADVPFHAAGNRLMILLDKRNVAPEGNKSLQLSLVNTIWAQDDYPVETSFLNTLSVNYDSGVKLLDFVTDPDGSRRIINDFVKGDTGGRIEDLIPEGVITTLTRVVLANALYFHGSWLQTFDERHTSDGPFETLDGRTVTVRMMRSNPFFPYAEGDGYQIIDVPYVGNALAMTIVLPEAGRFLEIRAALDNDWLTTARKDMSSTRETFLSLPKFNFAWGSRSLSEHLIRLGMVDAFDMRAADFTGITTSSRLYVTDVFHKAFIGVDESGTEAAAATAAIIGDTGMPSQSFDADRPFLFFIRDASGILLFAGQVTDPT